MVDVFNNELADAELERLALLAEECGEVVQIIGKIIRHGYKSCHPDNKTHSFPNRYLLEKELGDVVCAIEMLWRAGDVSREKIEKKAWEKWERVKPYLHHQERCRHEVP